MSPPSERAKIVRLYSKTSYGLHSLIGCDEVGYVAEDEGGERRHTRKKFRKTRVPGDARDHH